eukprot:c27047_g1_i1 orf=150-2450(+)
MALRDLVLGGGACAVPGAPASSSNPLGAFADSLLGSASKTQERLKELPELVGPGQSSKGDFGTSGPLTILPGSELERDHGQEPGSQIPEFLQQFRDADNRGYADAWNDAVGAQMPLIPYLQEDRRDPGIFSEFEQIYGQEASPVGFPPLLDNTPQRVLSGFLRSFLDSSRSEVPFHPVKLPGLGLSEADKCRIRDRSSIMAHHFFADKGHDYVNAQVNALLHSLDIESEFHTLGPQGVRSSELEEYWNESRAGGLGPMQGAGGSIFDDSSQWVSEFNQQHNFSKGGESWVDEFRQQQGSGWIDQFGEEQAQMTARAHLRSGDMGKLAALEQTQSLVDTLSQNQDPKFQNSKFLKFVSKMSRGELIAEDNQIKSSGNIDAHTWANEFKDQQTGSAEHWAAEFTAGEHAHRGDTWVNEYGREQNLDVSPSEGWVDEFSKLNVHDWAEEFDKQMSNNGNNWLDSYERFMEEELNGDHKLPASSRWIYMFADQNPYVGHANPLKEGQELFRRGLLSEAVLALEAEVLKNPDNAEGWRLLGIAHAENDDDRQAIASMVRARDADPANLEVLLALGVSHTNELEQREALKYLRGWLQHHSKYGRLVPPEQIEGFNHTEVANLFHEAAQMSPEDGDVHTVLGVLYNLSREYNKAVEAFQTALKLKPRDYSLWNKLGATLANSARSADAIYAYQEALDLKPNYVRAWSNMGISYANQCRYEESIRYYVRALCMNPKADNAWQYLRISLSCAARAELLDACDQRDLDLLQKEFPL